MRVSLLRAAIFPDPEADQGRQQFRVAVKVGAQIVDAVEEGYRLNLPLRLTTGNAAGLTAQFIAVSIPGVVVEAVKLAEDRSGDVIVRLYEALGAKARAVLTTSFDWSETIETDLLERPIATSAVSLTAERKVGLSLRPFQIVTLRLIDPIAST